MLTPESRKRDFPALEGIAYLNTAAESIPPLCVGEALHAYWLDKLTGMRGRDAHFAQVEACREVSARMLQLQPAEVAFCSCSSEAYNLLASALNLNSTDEVVLTDLDFPAGITPWLRASQNPGIRLWKARDGVLYLEDLLPLLGTRTRLVQVSLVSFYNGHRVDWAPMAAAVRALAPDAVLSVDITQALGRVEMGCAGADILISSTHKWTLGVHGGCIIGVPAPSAQKLTTRAGGWFHLQNAFDSDRFEKAVARPGAASFAVGMPNFAALYALNAALRYVEAVGVHSIASHANPLLERVVESLKKLGVSLLCPYSRESQTGIVAFRHERAAAIHAALEEEGIHLMYNAGRLRIAVHGYNTLEDIERLEKALARLL